MAGEAKRRQYSRQQFLLQHPHCCYCGAPATTTDHCPPRSMFDGRVWPEGYEFPCCAPCNAAGRYSEQIAAAVLRPSLLAETEASWLKTVEHLSRARPEVLEEWTSLSRNEARHHFRTRFGKDLGDRLRQHEYGVLKIGPITTEALEDVLAKVGMALFYKHIGRRCTGRVWVLRYDPLLAKQMAIAVEGLAPNTAEMQRGNANLADQFVYRYSAGPGSLCAVVTIRHQFAAVLTALDEPQASEFAASATAHGMHIPERRCPP
ncbi:hypothetical protein ROTAS13_04213 [Roseomonas sp. TAS13]|uniref:hypothetical protein n=1 Tax=Roseomonas sp. TAS13 TaxID=1926319 RepID=UPI000967F965|nr:hypothetical protein [Roseomonas sp. TAS13]GAV36526.1 hypothetical protein ROTAS13_04213 [Roseomonas sp. TAS13]